MATKNKFTSNSSAASSVMGIVLMVVVTVGMGAVAYEMTADSGAEVQSVPNLSMDRSADLATAKVVQADSGLYWGAVTVRGCTEVVAGGAAVEVDQQTLIPQVVGDVQIAAGDRLTGCAVENKVVITDIASNQLITTLGIGEIVGECWASNLVLTAQDSTYYYGPDRIVVDETCGSNSVWDGTIVRFVSSGNNLGDYSAICVRKNANAVASYSWDHSYVHTDGSSGQITDAWCYDYYNYQVKTAYDNGQSNDAIIPSGPAVSSDYLDVCYYSGGATYINKPYTYTWNHYHYYGTYSYWVHQHSYTSSLTYAGNTQPYTANNVVLEVVPNGDESRAQELTFPQLARC